jgi:UDP-glucose 4-epimerase
MKVSKAIVTGGAGFIGSHIVDALISRRVETWVIDDLSTGNLENLRQHDGNDLLHVVVADGRTINRALADVEHVDVLYHEAAIANVLKSVKDPMFVHDVNVNMTLEIMNFCVAKKIRRMVFASSAAVYGMIGDLRAREDMACRPSSPYGASKLAVEDYLHAYQQTYGLEPVILRYFNVFGPRQAKSDYSGVITLFVDAILHRRPITIFGDGRQVRDFVNIKDIIQANMLAMESEVAVGEQFNVATGHSTSIMQLLDTLKSVAGARDVQHTFVPPRPGDVRFGMASTGKIESVLKYRPRVSIKDGLEELFNHSAAKLEIQVKQGQR